MYLGRVIGTVVSTSKNEHLVGMKLLIVEKLTERLERAHQFGAVVFVLCSFGSVGFYRVPWTVWRDMKGRFGHKYITPQEAAPYEVRIGGPGVLLFLEGLEDTP